MRVRVRAVAVSCAVGLLAGAAVAVQELRGQILAVHGDVLTVESAGQAADYLLPTGIEIRARDQESDLTVAQLERGQIVVLEVAPRRAQSGLSPIPIVTRITIEGGPGLR